MRTTWRQSAPGRYIDLEWRNGDIYLEDGPDAWPKRGHEGVGGTFSLQEIRRRGREMFSDYDGLYERLLDDLAPELEAGDALHGVVATVDDDLNPHPVPCRFAFAGSRVYVYPATAESGEHVATTPRASLLIPGPCDDETGAAPARWTRVQGTAAVVDDPEWELGRAAELLAAKYGDTGTTASDDAAAVPPVEIDIDRWIYHRNSER
jgi:Pyridoxamine 5'-phosphate oxidase